MAGKAIIAAGLAILLAAGGSVILTGMGTTATTSCGSGTVDSTAASSLSVAGFSGDQLVNAGQIMNAATAVGLHQNAQLVGVTAAIGESTLNNITYGDSVTGARNPDGTLTSSIGLFQQQDWWGTTAQRMNPTQSAKLFFDRLKNVPGWEEMAPTAVIHAVQRNQDPDHYTKYVASAAEIVSTLTSSAGGGGCAASSNAQALAQELVTHIDNGTLTGEAPDHLREIRWIAQGQTMPECGIDVAILQVIVLAVRHFDRVGVGSINRNCTKELLGLGVNSAHYKNGGGHAVDFTTLNGLALTGADGQSIRLLGLLDPIMPPGSGAGQNTCRGVAHTTVVLTNFRQFFDDCTHLHIEVPVGVTPLRTG